MGSAASGDRWPLSRALRAKFSTTRTPAPRPACSPRPTAPARLASAPVLASLLVRARFARSSDAAYLSPSDGSANPSRTIVRRLSSSACSRVATDLVASSPPCAPFDSAFGAAGRARRPDHPGCGARRSRRRLHALSPRRGSAVTLSLEWKSSGSRLADGDWLGRLVLLHRVRRAAGRRSEREEAIGLEGLALDDADAPEVEAERERRARSDAELDVLPISSPEVLSTMAQACMSTFPFGWRTTR